MRNHQELWDKIDKYRELSNEIWEKASEVITDINDNRNTSRYPEFIKLMEDAKEVAEKWNAVLMKIHKSYKKKHAK